MNPREFHAAFVEDAREAYALFTSMRTEALLTLQAAHDADQAVATRPESLAFGAGRLALIAAVLKTRATTGVSRGTSPPRGGLAETHGGD